MREVDLDEDFELVDESYVLTNIKVIQLYLTTRTQKLMEHCDESGWPTLEEFTIESWLARFGNGLKVTWSNDGRSGRLDKDDSNIARMLVLGWAVFGKSLRYCASIVCQSRYFIASRCDQIYCDRQCGSFMANLGKRATYKMIKDRRGRFLD
jgi:hypothetical protein